MTPIFNHRIEVRFSDCDPMGHANNAKYLTYLEQARLAHWRAAWGFGTREDAPGVILARVEIDFRRPARYGETLDVRIGVAGIGRTSFTYDYEIVDEGGGLVATAKSVMVMFDYTTNTPVPIPDEIRAKLTAEVDVKWPPTAAG
jgi:acyl-CoA thioester hydrolase